MEFDIKRPTRHCSRTGQPIGPGQVYFTVLVETDSEELERQDILAEAWSGAPEECIAWWRSQIPLRDEGRVYWAPADVLRSVFQYYLERPDQQDAAYVMGLLLLRKRMLQHRESVTREGAQWLILFDPKAHSSFELRESAMSAERAEAIQRELADKLFTTSGAVEADSEQAGGD